MKEQITSTLFDLIAGRRGHFQLESGYHSELWFDVDTLFTVPRQIEPFVQQLAHSIRPYGVAAVCGPMVGGAFLAQLLAQALDAQFCFTERVMPRDANGLFQARYLLPAGLRAAVQDRPLAIVDDIMSAGSALRGTYAELQTLGATNVVAGALLVLGDTGAAFFAERGVAVEAVARESYLLWLPSECPHCVAGTPLEKVAVSAK